MDYLQIKVRKQSSKCSLHSQCFRTLIRYIVSIWIPALYLLLYGVIPLRMISWQIIFRKLKSVCLLRAQRFRNIICHNSLGEVTDRLSSNRISAVYFTLISPRRIQPLTETLSETESVMPGIILSVSRMETARMYFPAGTSERSSTVLHVYSEPLNQSEGLARLSTATIYSLLLSEAPISENAGI